MSGALVATYRLQLTPAFGFASAADANDYIAALGASHLYLSPIFEARPGSTHGYDQTDPTRIRAELGGEREFDVLVDAAHRVGLGIILDIVPNHMSAHHANPWWNGLLKGGPASEFNRYFDVHWEEANGRVVLPVLGDALDACLDKGEFTLERDAQLGPCIRYFERLFPLRDDRAAPRGADDREGIARSLAEQHYELAWWRDGLRRINYRRFFDIADLAGVRTEDQVVFETMHAKVFDLAKRGRIDGVRVDHIDGLSDPQQYLRRLRGALDDASPRGARLPIFVEKILASDESLPSDWPVEGTTGYEFLAATSNLSSDPLGVTALRRHPLLAAPDFRTLAISCKREVAETILAPELSRLCCAVGACLDTAEIAPEAATLRDAVVGLSAALDVYRTYIDDDGPSSIDARRLREAAERSHADETTTAMLVELLMLSGRFAARAPREAALRVARQWQQFTGPLAAKGIEDTALYRDAATPWLNDVGSEPLMRDPRAVVDQLVHQRRDRPLTFNATDTHDSKRSEDVRARLAVLSRSSARWTSLLDDALSCLALSLEGRAPSAIDLSLLLHASFALLPSGDIDARLAGRLKDYLTKAAREAKLGSTWLDPNAEYEEGCRQAVDVLLFSESCAAIRARLSSLAHETRPWASRLSIGSLLLKTLFPGTPDVYQGTGLLTLALVDPDNRGPVDFVGRARALEEIRATWRAAPATAAANVLADPSTDVAKLFATWRALAIRRRLLSSGDLRLESAEWSPWHWHWRISAGHLHCAVRVDLSDADLAKRGTLDLGIDQLTGADQGAQRTWASIVVEGVVDCW